MPSLATDAQVLNALREARELISRVEAWTPRDYAANASGQWVPVASQHAVRYSVLGAIVWGGRGASGILLAAKKVLQESDPKLCAKMNSGTLGHDEAIQLLTAAIAALSSAQSEFDPERYGATGRPSTRESTTPHRG